MVRSNTVELTAAVQTSLNISGSVEWYEGYGWYYEIPGKLTRNDTGAGVPNKHIIFYVDGVKSTKGIYTHADPATLGEFTIGFWASEIGAGTHTFEAEFEGDAEFAGCESEAVLPFDPSW